MTEKRKNKETKERSNTLLTWVCVIAIAIVIYFVFSPSLDNGFTNWDDNFYVTDNPLVVNQPVSPVKIAETPVDLNYLPVTILSFVLNYQAGKLEPVGYHLVNIIFHLLNTILVFFFIFFLTRRNLLMAAIVSLFFGIHPMHVESVAWVSERKDVLYVFFFLAGLIMHLRYSETRKILWYWLTFLFFILSCLSKGMAVVFPVILLLVDYLRGVKWDRKLIIEKIPFFLLSLVFGIIAIKIQSVKSDHYTKVFTALQWLMIATYSTIMYIVKLFVPFKLSVIYPYPTSGNGSLPLIFYLSPFILLGILVGLIYLFRKKEKDIVFGLLFYFVSVALVVQFIPTGPAFMPDRYSYLSYIGLLFVVAHVINYSWQGKKGVMASLKYPLIVIAVIGAVIFSYRAYSRTQVWANSEVLWTNVIDTYPDAAGGYAHRANYYRDNNEAEKALSDYNMALQLDTTNGDTYYNRGVIYSDYFYKNDMAIADYTKSIELNPAFSSAYDNRGLAYVNTGKTAPAMADFNKSIALDSNNARAYGNRAFLYFSAGKIDSALMDCNKAIAHDPTSASYHLNRGLAYRAINNFSKAIDDFTIGIQLNPKNVDSYYNLIGMCNGNLQNYNAAAADFSKAIEINPLVPDYWLNRAMAEGKLGQDDNAKADAEKGQELKER